MDWHPTDEDLILHYYREAVSDPDARLVAHLEACPACASELRALTATLALAEAPVPEPDEQFEQRIWSAVGHTLQRERRLASLRPIALVGTLAATLAVVTAAGVYETRGRGPVPPAAPAHATADREAVRERVLLTALDTHLSETEILLVELLHAPEAAGTAWDFQRRTADDLVASGRLYRQTARQTGQIHLVDMLDDLEGVLVEVATAPPAVDEGEVDRLRARIEDDALLFKVRAIATDIRGRQQVLMRQP